MDVGERNSIGYNNPPQFKQVSSPRLNSAPLISSPSSKTRRETLDHHHLHHDHHHQEKKEEQRPRKDPNPDPGPPQLVSQPPHPAGTQRDVVRYRECLKNHAASKGTHVVDGCGEFMPSGEDGTPEALKCAACECHRSFHRRQAEGESQPSYYTRNMTVRVPSAHHPPPGTSVAKLPHRMYHHQTPPFMMAFGGAVAESSSEDLNAFQLAQTSKKKSRTKFTQQQKEKMHDFAERIGWKIQKQDEQEVVQFCNDFGLKRQVFKVWMHNNKQAMKKKL